MGDVVRVEFRSGRLKEIAVPLRQTLRAFAELYGDDPALLERKADELVGFLTEIGEPETMQLPKPGALDPQSVTKAIEQAAEHAYTQAQTRIVMALVKRVPALCTSMLAGPTARKR
jgi:hypothetical protein